MEFRMTRHQVARRARPDAEVSGQLLLIKRVTELRATYQIRLLTCRAVRERRKLIINVPGKCKIHSDLNALAKEYPRNLEIVRN